MTDSPRRCSVDECTRGYYAMGHCKHHYDMLRRRGTVVPLELANTQPCTIEGCSALQIAKGLCSKHYRRMHKHGDPLHTERLFDGKTTERNRASTAAWGRMYPGRRAYNVIQQSAKRRGKEWALSVEQVDALIRAPCHYCGAEPRLPDERSGIDRVDNARGYVTGNCVPCCPTCNSAKGTKTVAEFEEWARRLAEQISKRVPALRAV